MERTAGLVLALAPALATTAACGDGGDGARATITVFAAASLTDAFTELGHAFEADGTDGDAGITVELSFAGSSALREQVLAGAPADVFASADPASMQALVDEGAATAPVDFAGNSLQIVVPAGNPAGLTGLADFAHAELLLGLCAEEVPCGRFARQALASAGVTPSIDTNEPDVRSLLTKIEAGELDAGIVYRTDVLAGGGAVEGIDLPADQDVAVTYPIAALTDAGDAGAAAAFVAFVLSDEGQAILTRHGFDAVAP